MTVAVLISGREAIPVRAIPYRADSTVSADILVKALFGAWSVHGRRVVLLADRDSIGRSSGPGRSRPGRDPQTQKARPLRTGQWALALAEISMAPRPGLEPGTYGLTV